MGASQIARREIRRAHAAAKFVQAVHRVSGFMALTLVEEYGWDVDEVTELFRRMNERMNEQSAEEAHEAYQEMASE